MQNKPRAFIIHEQLHRDKYGVLGPKFDTRPAETFGERIVLFKDGASALAIEDLTDIIKEKFDKFEFSANDFLVFCGAPKLICGVLIAAADYIYPAPVKILEWNNRQLVYEASEYRRLENER